MICAKGALYLIFGCGFVSCGIGVLLGNWFLIFASVAVLMVGVLRYLDLVASRVGYDGGGERG